MSLHIFADVEQRSDKWYELRRGIVTASAVDQLIIVGAPDATTIDCPVCGAVADSPCLSAARKTPTPIKTIHAERTAAASELPPTYSPARGDTSRSLINLLAAERITGHVEDTFTSSDMWRGIVSEPFARELYSEHYAEAVECGFMLHESDNGIKIGLSPDGLVGDDGLIEIKAPRQKTHLATIIADEVPIQYVAQCQTALFVSGRAWIDFVSYCGGMPLYVKRVLPDPQWFYAISEAVWHAEQAITETVAEYTRAVEGLPVTERIDFNRVELTLE